MGPVRCTAPPRGKGFHWSDRGIGCRQPDLYDTAGGAGGEGERGGFPGIDGNGEALHITSYGVVQSQTWVVFDGREFCPLREELSRLQSIGKLRCPRCLHGAVFESLWKMHRFCPFCRLEYEREQGYFLGAMYFSYGMALALSAPLVLVLLVFGGFSVNEVILTLGVTITFLSPLLFRYSRILWMHFDQFWDPR